MPMKKLDNYHNNVLTVISIREEYIQDKNWFFLTINQENKRNQK